MAATEVATLPDDAIAGVFRTLPLQTLAVVRCVCKPWRDIVDGRSLLLPHLLPRSVRGIFVNYIDHHRPHHFTRPTSSAAVPKVDGMLSFLPNTGGWCTSWSVLDHCNGLLLCDMEWRTRLCVCNSATRRWTVLPGRHADDRRRRPYAGAYIAFDPAASPHYEVVLVPDVPAAPSREDRRRAEKERRAVLWEKERDAPFCLDWFFSGDGDGGGASFGEEEEIDQRACYHDEEFRRLPCVEEEELEREIDPWRFTEWPPTPWALRVFSSRTGGWEERAFVREGMPAGTVEKMRLNGMTSHFARWPYAVYHRGSLYVHCQGSFVTRLSFSTGNYRVIEMPTNLKCAQPYLGELQNSVCFGIVRDGQLKIWILNESCDQIEWLLKYEAEVGHYAQYLDSISYDHSGTKPDGSWIIEENIDIHDTDDDVESQSEESYEWDSDNNDTFTVDMESLKDHHSRHLHIMGFHPYKEVVFMFEPFGVVAYHLNSTRIQYLGNSRPDCYSFNHSNGIYESFVYTPCMIGDLLLGDQSGQSSSED